MNKLFSRSKIIHSIIWITIISCSFSFIPVRADTVSELREKIEDREKQIEALDKEIKRYEQELLKVGSEKQTLQNAIKTLDVTRNKLLNEIQVTENQIAKTNLSIEELAIEILRKENQIAENKNAVSKTLRKLQSFDNVSTIELVLASQSISDVWSEIGELDQFQKSIGERVKELDDLKAELVAKKLENEAQKGELVQFKTKLDGQKTVVEGTKKEKNTLLTQTQSKEGEYQKLLAQKQAERARFEQEIRNLEAELQFTLDPDSIPRRGSGVFSWPLDSVVITQEFGATREAVRLYTSGTHNGIDFRASKGTPVKAVLSGKVTAVNTEQVAAMCQYGKWVLIEHPNGLSTLYAHLSLVNVKQGDRVSTGEIIGYSGDTGYATGPHLHLTTYASAAVTFTKYTCNSGITLTIPVAATTGYLDPLDYLPK